MKKVDVLSKLPYWLIGDGTRFLTADSLLSESDCEVKDGKPVDPVTEQPLDRKLTEAHIFDAKLVSSRSNSIDYDFGLIGGKTVTVKRETPRHYHWVMLDLDMDAMLIPSSKSGHHHLYLEHVLDEEQMEKLLTVLVEVGIVNKGVKALQWDVDKELTLRLPWVRKGEDKTLREQMEPTPTPVETDIKPAE
jgi:hypothetical protein